MAWVTAAAALGVGVAASLVGERLASALIGGASFALTATIIAILARTITDREGIDTQVVIGVLSAYLLIALLFASLNQVLAAANPHGYLRGVSGLPNASDQLYFSVITMTTVGYGDIVPGSAVARAVAVVEALTGQLYLVSVVAAVIGGWRRADR
jgi:voltage-gated potassium channel Kch